MTKPLTAAAALLASTAAGQVLADAAPMRHGLWLHTYTMQTQSGQMENQLREAQEYLANLPPEQREAVEKLMGEAMASYGIELGPDNQSIKICISKERAARGIIPHQEDDCTQEITERKGNTIKMTFACNGNPPSSGESVVTFHSPTHYTGKSIVNTTVEGRPEKITIEQSGKWLSYDCGNLKAR